MKIGLIGLGKMGANMAKKLILEKHEVAGYDITPQNVRDAEKNGVTGSDSLEDLVSSLEKPRNIWVMVPHGAPTNAVIKKLIALLDKDDLITDGGNSHYKDSQTNFTLCKVKGIHFVDAGVSGGIWGLEVGYNIMAGGTVEAFKRMEPIFKSLAPESGYLHIGESGSGHFVKMMHNALEYVMLEGIGEAFECMEKSDFDIDLRKVSNLWNHGSVVRCWLLELLTSAFEKEGDSLKEIASYIDDSGTGRWATNFAVENSIPVPAITLSLYERFSSRGDGFSAKVIAALRKQFGGHAVKEEK